MTDPHELETVGVYDPKAADAAERLSLLQLALEHGATIDEIRVAIDAGRLHVLAAELLMLDRPRTLTLADAAATAGVTLDFAARVWRALAFPLAAPDAPVCTDADVDGLAFYGDVASSAGPDAAISLARAVGTALARTADASVEVVRAGIEAPLRHAGGTDVDVARQLVDVTAAMLPRLYPMFEAVHRRHLVESARRYSLWGASATEASTTEAVVGFADLVGYSALNEHLTAGELDALIDRFEQRALDAVARPGGRLVKVIGDEVMFAAGSATDAALVAGHLLDATDLPPLRIGLATGTVLAREGDLYGTPVNLAARLEALAEPGQALVDAETARRLDASTVEPLGAHAVAGFATPVDVFALRR